MKIICIGRNYIEHAKELNNPVPAEPVFFMKSEASIIRNNFPFFYPAFSKEIHHEAEIVLHIGKVGKHIQERFAHTYYDAIGVGIDFTARDIQQQCKEKGLPWEKAKAFDGSAPISEFIPKESFEDLNNISIRLDINGTTVQDGTSKDMIFTFDKIIAYISLFITLKIGDLIFTGTPAGVGPVQINDRLEVYLDNKKMMDFNVK